jgi:CheY-like chemotaxis protein
VVDDGPVNRLLAVRILEKKGFQVHAADNASKAMALMLEQPFDLVFMDVQMPEMDGLEATRLIRKGEGPGKHLPIVAMTAHALKSDRDRCLASGMDGYISKPFKPEELLSAVEDFALMGAQSGPLVLCESSGPAHEGEP